ncbi:dCMP deaminase [uncultured bacterium]|nr:dCMP deaminase [uncultured bacterium]
MHTLFLQQAIDLACENVKTRQGGPFGAVIVKHGQVIATGVNQVTTLLDPTAHAEIQAIRTACQVLSDFQLIDCVLYSSCEPCPMCLGAIYWARLNTVYFACNRHDAMTAGFDDSFIYDDFALPLEQRRMAMQQIQLINALQPFEIWTQQINKTLY